jgi:hypothetical protein
MNSTPQVETQEIADADLDNVSGGLVGDTVSGLVGTVSGLVNVGGVTGTVDSVVDPMVNTSAVTGIVSGL